jgi:hypothetical protein
MARRPAQVTMTTGVVCPSMFIGYREGEVMAVEARVGEIAFDSDKTIEVAVEHGMVILRVVDIDIEITTKMTIATSERLRAHLATAAIVAPHPYAIENMIRAQQ